MGPRKYFLDVCAYDENGIVRINHAEGYSSLDFCNCLAEEMIPLMTKKEINYFFAENRHTEIFKDELLSKKASQCIISAKEKFAITPPPQETWEVTITPPPQRDIVSQSVSTIALIDSIIRLVDYEKKFYQLLEGQLDELGADPKVEDADLTALRKKITFDEINPDVIKNGYMDYSDEEVKMIYEYLASMSHDDLSYSTVKYEQEMVSYLSLFIELKVNDYMKLNE